MSLVDPPRRLTELSTDNRIVNQPSATVHTPALDLFDCPTPFMRWEGDALQQWWTQNEYVRLRRLEDALEWPGQWREIPEV